MTGLLSYLGGSGGASVGMLADFPRFQPMFAFKPSV
jgi:hypothetical protein